jgi:hypothetical protein
MGAVLGVYKPYFNLNGILPNRLGILMDGVSKEVESRTEDAEVEDILFDGISLREESSKCLCDT